VSQLSLPIVLSQEDVVLIKWQKYCPELAVTLIEYVDGWWSGMNYFPKSERECGLCEPMRGPYCSKEAAVRNAVAFGVFCLRMRGTSIPRQQKIYRAAGMHEAASRLTSRRMGA
jgi:hypothetical protein